MTPGRSCPFVVAALLLLAAPALAPTAWTGATSVAAQELGVYRSVAQSSLAELSEPAGLGAYLRIRPVHAWSVRFGYHRQEDDSQRVGEVCNNFVVAFRCNDEPIETRTRVHGGSALASWLASPVRQVELELGAGISLNDVAAEEQTESGRASPIFFHESAQFGALLAVHGRLRPLAGLPLVIEVGLVNHYLRLGACAEDPRRYDPYCAPVNLREVRLGAGLAW
jgi:hypothetical protein